VPPTLEGKDVEPTVAVSDVDVEVIIASGMRVVEDEP